MTDRWDAELYDARHAFVWKHGEAVLQLLVPKPGERILDVGCGTGGRRRRKSPRPGPTSSASTARPP